MRKEKDDTMYTIINKKTKEYVNMSWEHTSGEIYTRDIEKALKFPNYEKALRSCEETEEPYEWPKN